ncbi:MAG: septation protein A [Gammaproteobacteria bacterium]
MKLLFDFFPILLFFAAYKMQGIFVATTVVIIAAFIQVTVFWLLHRRFEKMHLITLSIIVLFGGATLVFQDPVFIKWKPTVVNWLFAIIFLASQFIGDKSLLERMMSHAITVSAIVWLRLNLMWVTFFLCMGIANLYVAYHFDENTWVNFKLFGMMGLTLVFVIGQTLYLARHLEPAGKDES